MPIKTSEKVKASRKNHTVLSCLTSVGSFAAPDFVGTIPPRFPIDSEEGQEFVSEGLCRSGHQSISMLRITSTILSSDEFTNLENASLSVSEQVPHEKSRSSSRKSAAGTVPTVFGSSAGHQIWETTARLCF